LQNLQAQTELSGARRHIEGLEIRVATAEQAVAEARRLKEEVQMAEGRYQQLLASSRREASEVQSSFCTTERERDLLQQEVGSQPTSPSHL
jgi:hypothetical protein